MPATMVGAAAAGFMDLDDIKALIEAMQASDLAEFEVSRDGWTLRMVRRTTRPTAAEHRPESPAFDGFVPLAHNDTGAPPDRAAIRAPLSGIVHLTPSPGAPPFVAPGQAVAAGSTLCVIEAMKVFNAVLAERDGTVEAVLVSTETEVEAGQTLMRIV